jgi:hypothetical protein
MNAAAELAKLRHRIESLVSELDDQAVMKANESRSYSRDQSRIIAHSFGESVAYAQAADWLRELL